MKKYHVNSKGEAKSCKAEKGLCPYGGKDAHYSSKDEARSAYETAMEQEGLRGAGRHELLQSKKLDQIVEHLHRRGHGNGKGSISDPINVKGDVLLAARLISEGKHVRLNKVHEVGTLLKELRAIVSECEAKGDAAPTFDLCKVSVPKTNLFCATSKGIPRVQMPQLTGFPAPSSLASDLPTATNGKVDVSSLFKDELLARGISVKTKTVNASFLRASQSELDGPKVAKKVAKARAGKLEDKTIFVTADGYIIDGHHFWATKVALEAETGERMRLRVEMVDMEIGEALDFANAFTKKMGVQAKSLA